MSNAARIPVRILKTPGEVLRFDMDFTDKLAAGETLSSFAEGFPRAIPNGLTVSGVVSGVDAQITAGVGTAEELFTTDKSTDRLSIAGHDFTDGDEVFLEGSLPAPLKQNRTYYVRDKTANDFKLTEIKDKDGNLGKAIDITQDGEGLIGHDYVCQARCTTSNGQTVDGEIVVRAKRV